MTVIVIIYFLLAAFVGYITGRIGDYYINFWIGDQAWFNRLPDHWIYGLILIILGIVLLKDYWGLYILAFGIGHFISDLNDFLHLKFSGSDNKDKSERRFWHID